MTKKINITGKGERTYAKKNLGKGVSEGIDISEKISQRTNTSQEKIKQDAEKISQNYQHFREKKQQKYFSPAEQIAISQLMQEHSEQAPQGQGISKRAVETLLSHVVQSNKKSKKSTQPKQSPDGVKKLIQNYLEKKTNLEKIIPQQQQKNQTSRRQMTSTKTKKSGTIAGKVAAWSVGILGTTYLMTS